MARLLLTVALAFGFVSQILASSQLESPSVDMPATDYAAVPRDQTSSEAAVAIIGRWAVVPSQELSPQAAARLEAMGGGDAAPFVIQNNSGQFGLADGTILITARRSEDLKDIAVDYALTLEFHFSGTNTGQFASARSIQEAVRVIETIRLDRRVVNAGLNSVYDTARPN